jgi:hypothetical protein
LLSGAGIYLIDATYEVQLCLRQLVVPIVGLMGG